MEGVGRGITGDAARPRPVGTAAAWVRRLFERRGLCPDERRLFWYGQHQEQFLRWYRKRSDPASLGDLQAGYVRELDTTQPPLPAWQMAQIRQALDAFAQDWRGRMREVLRVRHYASRATSRG